MHHVAPRRLRVHSAPLKSALSFFLIINLVGLPHGPPHEQGTTPCFKPKTRRLIMLTKTKIALAALAVVLFATPSFAYDYQPTSQYTVKQERSASVHSQRLIEGRNSAVFDGNVGTSTGREAMVQALGN